MAGAVEIAIICFLVLVLIAGLFGAVYILAMIWHHKPSNIFVIGLIQYVTWSDLGVLLGACLPQMYQYDAPLRWIYGDALCRIKYLLPEMVLLINSYLLVMFVVETLINVSKVELRKQPKLNVVAETLVAISIVLAVPQSFIHGTRGYVTFECVRTGLETSILTGYVVFHLTVSRIIPCILLVPCAVYIWNKGMRGHGSGGTEDGGKELSTMAVCIALLYVVCNVPDIAVGAIYNFSTKRYIFGSLKTGKHVTEAILVVRSAINPYIIWFTGKHFILKDKETEHAEESEEKKQQVELSDNITEHKVTIPNTSGESATSSQ